MAGATLRSAPRPGRRPPSAIPLVARKVPLLAKALPWVGHAPTRNRGTVGGSIANGDPAAEIPLVAVTLEATLVVQTRRRRQRAAGRLSSISGR